MRQRARVDFNQASIVEALRQVGASVTPLHQVGRGFPDLAVGKNGRTYLLEVKQPGEKLTPAEEAWRGAWTGHAATVSTVEEALAAIGLWYTGGE